MAEKRKFGNFGEGGTKKKGKVEKTNKPSEEENSRIVIAGKNTIIHDPLTNPAGKFHVPPIEPPPPHHTKYTRHYEKGDYIDKDDKYADFLNTTIKRNEPKPKKIKRTGGKTTIHNEPNEYSYHTPEKTTKAKQKDYLVGPLYSGSARTHMKMIKENRGVRLLKHRKKVFIGHEDMAREFVDLTHGRHGDPNSLTKKAFITGRHGPFRTLKGNSHERVMGTNMGVEEFQEFDRRLHPNHELIEVGKPHSEGKWDPRIVPVSEGGMDPNDYYYNSHVKEVSDYWAPGGEGFDRLMKKYKRSRNAVLKTNPEALARSKATDAIKAINREGVVNPDDYQYGVVDRKTGQFAPTRKYTGIPEHRKWKTMSKLDRAHRILRAEDWRKQKKITPKIRGKE